MRAFRSHQTQYPAHRRSVKIMRRKAGGTAGKNSEKYSLNLPAGWLHTMGLSKEDRVELSFDGEKITIQPLASTDPDVFRRNAEQKGHRLKEYRYFTCLCKNNTILAANNQPFCCVGSISKHFCNTKSPTLNICFSAPTRDGQIQRQC